MKESREKEEKGKEKSRREKNQGEREKKGGRKRERERIIMITNLDMTRKKYESKSPIE